MKRKSVEILNWIHSNCGEYIKVSDLAQRFFLSPRQLQRIFVAEVGRTPKEVLDEIRLKNIEELLEKEKSVEVVAELCGFCSEESMDRFFRRYHNVGPRKYLERYK